MDIRPFGGSYNLKIKLIRVLFPQPEGPAMPIQEPGGNFKIQIPNNRFTVIPETYTAEINLSRGVNQ